MLSWLNETLSKWQEWWWLALIGFAIGAVPAWIPVIREWLAPKFRFQAITVFHGRGGFVQFQKWPEGWRSHPIDVAIYVRITNSDSRTRGISGYELEVKSSEGWRRLDRVELPPPAILEFRALATAEWSRIDFSKNNVHARMRAGAIDPGQSIEDWFFFTSAGGPEYLSSMKRLSLIAG